MPVETFEAFKARMARGAYVDPDRAEYIPQYMVRRCADEYFDSAPVTYVGPFPNEATALDYVDWAREHGAYAYIIPLADSYPY